MTLSTSAASKKWKKIHKATMTVYIDALWIFFYRLFMFDAFVLSMVKNTSIIILFFVDYSEESC